MIDEMICAFDSPGRVSAILIIALLFRNPTNMRGAATGHQQRKYAALVYALGRSELVGCGVHLGNQCLPSLRDESARAMPMPEQRIKGENKLFFGARVCRLSQPLPGNRHDARMWAQLVR